MFIKNECILVKNIFKSCLLCGSWDGNAVLLVLFITLGRKISTTLVLSLFTLQRIKPTTLGLILCHQTDQIIRLSGYFPLRMKCNNFGDLNFSSSTKRVTTSNHFYYSIIFWLFMLCDFSWSWKFFICGTNIHLDST